MKIIVTIMQFRDNHNTMLIFSRKDIDMNDNRNRKYTAQLPELQY